MPHWALPEEARELRVQAEEARELRVQAEERERQRAAEVPWETAEPCWDRPMESGL